MKKIIAAALFSFATVSAFAQVNASTNATTNSSSGATNQGVNQGITFNSAAQPTTTTVKTTGNAVVSGFAGSFSSDYCGGTAGLAVGGPGFAVSAGAPKIDHGCTLLRSFERLQQAAASDPADAPALHAAALDVLAEVDPAVRKALEKHKLIAVADDKVRENDQGQLVYAKAQP
jgi:hypothetical protein